MMFDYSKLRGRIREKMKSEAAFAEAMGLSSVSISAKLNSKVPWTDIEMMKACDILDIALEFIPLYFFTEKVVNS